MPDGSPIGWISDKGDTEAGWKTAFHQRYSGWWSSSTGVSPKRTPFPHVRHASFLRCLCVEPDRTTTCGPTNLSHLDCASLHLTPAAAPCSRQAFHASTTEEKVEWGVRFWQGE